ncbi:type II secretion system protein GspL [Rhodoferax sp.]|uniref:type II secretion system protein GspL n=1 Tax=Rhodoferax sp. TaxID=50421 RepID=UPI00276C157C|nr:type II secretion system protein GspL [Rhodoferax sp.]
MTTLIVSLPLELSGASTTFAYVLTSDGAAITQHAQLAPALLPTLTLASSELVAVVPIGALSWHRVTLPKGLLGKNFFQDGSTQRLRAVLDGLLEERTLDEPSQLHFALEPQPQADAPVWVAACNRAWLHAALQLLERAGRPAARVVPEFAPGTSDSQLQVIGADPNAQIVKLDSSGVTLLPLTPASVAFAAWPDASALSAEPGAAELAEQLFKRPVTIEQAGQRWLAAAQSGWDLAQFDLLSNRRTRTWRKFGDAWRAWLQAPRWRAARWAVLTLLLTQLVGLNAWAWKENASLRSKHAALRDALTGTFPGVKTVIDAPVQMAREVAALRQASGTLGPRDLESMLSALGSVVPPGKSFARIDFAGDELKGTGLALSPAELSAVTTQLKSRGYAVRAEGDRLSVKPEGQP